MNRLSAYIPDTRISYCKTISKFDYRMLMNLGYGYDIREDNLIIERYKYYNQSQNVLFKTDDENHASQEDLYMFRFIREKILEETEAELNYVVNTLVMYLYTVQKDSNKKMLWSSFGDVIVDNLKKNVKGKICLICGKRFEPRDNANTVYCSDECYKLANRQKAYVRWESKS